MYCKNCGNPVDPNASICVGCGFQNGTGCKYCANCGNEVTLGAAFCLRCGYALENPVVTQALANAKSKTTAGLLGILLGWVGAHNFYLGYYGKAIAQLLITLLSCFWLSPASFIWGLIEGILILNGGIDKDAKGTRLK